LGADERIGIPIAAAQCGCSAEEWSLKSLEASPSVLNSKIQVHHPWATYYFMPQDLATSQDGMNDWQRRDKLTQSIVVDRLRILRLSREYDITSKYPKPSKQVVEAAKLVGT
jgi:hypothetical protein